MEKNFPREFEFKYCIFYLDFEALNFILVIIPCHLLSTTRKNHIASYRNKLVCLYNVQQIFILKNSLANRAQNGLYNEIERMLFLVWVLLSVLKKNIFIDFRRRYKQRKRKCKFELIFRIQSQSKDPKKNDQEGKSIKTFFLMNRKINVIRKTILALEREFFHSLSKNS